ncbi:hypothetical protein [Clostridium algidicarnis]|uniref:Uncharacterized protein n=2 Tax=Clostridium algidicarnis TaxID=37659 RepID=A0A2S6FVZ7_9CLOT|nr:hypothetical protein [Clostridium algidicarnis]PPK46963.1 hypothetical protein BD821_1142 [Clostridium algidicarnis DSM 15099]
MCNIIKICNIFKESMVIDMRKKKNGGLLGTMMILGTATAAAAVAYKLKQSTKEDIANNFDEYMDNATKSDNKEPKGFNIKDIIGRVRQNIKDEVSKQDEGFNNKPHKTTMMYRKNRVYNKPVKGIRGQKGI